MGTWCLFCIGMYGLNLLLLVAGLLAMRNPSLLKQHSEGEDRPGIVATIFGAGGDRTSLVMLVAGLAIFALSVGVYNGQKRAVEGPAASLDPAALADAYHQPRGQVQLSGSEPMLGRSDAPYLIVEWADYACPHCAIAGGGVKELVGEHSDIQLRYKHYPISNVCNPHVGGEGHTTSCEAAAAADCARAQGRFWEFSDLLFKNQRYQSSEDIRFMAKQIGLDMAALESCLADPLTAQRVKTDCDHANEVELTGTPTFFLKGLFGEDWVQIKSRPALIEAVIEAHRSGIELLPPRPAPEQGH